MGLVQIFFKKILGLSFFGIILLVPSQNIWLFSINESLWFSAIIWYSGVLLAFISFWAISQRLTISNFQLFVYLSFPVLVLMFITTNNLLVFFMCYELFLLPSFAIIFLGSPNRRGVLASIYFLMWTQIGSFLVFIAIILSFIYSNSFLFINLVDVPSIAIYCALCGFGIKIPVWPAHYWLTKTHVEAPTYFSIYLSGFLVKTALYGVWVFSSISINYNQSIFLLIAIIGVIDASLKMWAQVDLKKLVAYGTVQEMNLILVGFIVGTASAIKASSLFIIAHTILSTIFFLFIDTLYRRFASRSTTSIRGLLQTAPVLGYMLFICCLLFAGLPFTLKFVVELYIFTQLFQISNSLVIIVLFICNWFGTISFMKNWMVPLFGSTKNQSCNDISISELLIFGSLCGLLVILSLSSIYII